MLFLGPLDKETVMRRMVHDGLSTEQVLLVLGGANH
jgi:hypothetical protein